MQKTLNTIGQNLPNFQDSIFLRDLNNHPDTSLYNIVNSIAKRFVPSDLKENAILKSLFSNFSSSGFKMALGGYFQVNTIQAVTGAEKEKSFANYWIFSSGLYLTSLGSEQTLDILRKFDLLAGINEKINVFKNLAFVTVGQFGKSVSEQFSKNFTDSIGEYEYTLESKTKGFIKDFKDFFKTEKETRLAEFNQLQYYTAFQLEKYIDLLDLKNTTDISETEKQARIDQAKNFIDNLYSKSQLSKKQDIATGIEDKKIVSPVYEYEFQTFENREKEIGLDKNTKSQLNKILDRLREFSYLDKNGNYAQREGFLGIGEEHIKKLNEMSIFPHFKFSDTSFKENASDSFMYLTSNSTVAKLHNISNFQKNFKIPYLFNPLSVFQFKFFEQLETREFFTTLDRKDTFKSEYVEEHIIKKMLQNDDFVKQFRNYLKQDRSSQTEEYNVSELFGYLKVNQRDFALRKYSKNTKSFIENFLKPSEEFITVDEIYENQLKLENGELIDEKKLFYELIQKSRNKKQEHFINSKAFVSDGKVYFEQKLSIFKNSKQSQNLGFDELKDGFSFGKSEKDSYLHFDFVEDDKYYYQLEKSKIGQTLTKISDQQYGNIALIGNKKEKMDLPFNQSYNFTPNKFDEIKELLNYANKSNVINKGLKIIDTDPEQSPKDVKSIYKLMEVTNGAYLNKNIIKNVWGIEINTNDVENFKYEYLEQMEFFQEIQEKLFKIQMPQHDREAYLNALPVSQKFEVDIYRSVKNSETFSAIDLQTQVTQLGETKGDLMYKVIQQKRIMEISGEKLDEIISEKANDVQTYQYALYNKMLTEVKDQLDTYDLTKIADRKSQQKWFENYREPLSNQKPIAMAVKNRLKRLDLMNRIIENEKTDKIEQSLKFKSSSSNQIIFSSVSKTKDASQKFFLNKSGESSQSSLLFHYVVDRPIQLLEEWFLGRPNPKNTFNQFESLKQVAIKRILPVQGVITGFKQFDQFLTKDDEKEQPIYVPTKLLSETYTSFMQGLLKISEVTQTTKILTELSKSFPHVLSTTVQDISQYMAGSGDMFLLQGAASYLENIPDQEKYQLQVTGNKDVPVKQARWWEMGRTPFQGGKTLYYRPHQQFLEGSQWEFTDTLYGSKKEYLEYGTLFPTPINLFGIKPIFNPNYFITKHQEDRPYPYANNSNLSYIPFLGPLQGGIQNLFTGNAEHQFLQSSSQSININDFNFTIDQSMKIPLTDQSAISSIKNKQLYFQNEKIETQNPVSEGFSKERKHVEDYLGMIGFVGSLNKTENTELKKEVANPDLMLGNRLYYQKELGSMFGQTEYFRRFVNNYYGKYGSKYYNPIPNAKFITEYDWLPKEYYIDFFHGDVYQSMPYGEVRLPGQAYERTHELIDDYGKIDQFKIIQNVAPYSRSYAIRKTKILKNIESYNEPNKYHITTAIEEGDDVRKKINNYDYPLNEDLISKTIIVESINEDGTINQKNEKVPVRIAGASLDVNKVAKHIFETESVEGIEQAYVEAEKRIEQVKGMIGDRLSGYIQEDKNKQYTMDEKGNVFLELINKPIQTKEKQLNLPIANENQWQDYQQYYRFETPLLLTLQQIQEGKSHLYNFKNEKFSGNFSQLENYERYNVFGKQSQSWNNPVSDFISPIVFNNMNMNPLYSTAKGIGIGIMSGTNLESKTLQQMTSGALNLTTSLLGAINPMLPSDTTNRYELEEKYLYQKNERGERSLLNQQKYQKTPKEIISLIPGSEQDYLPLFINASTKEIERIKEIQPLYTTFALEQIQQFKENKINGIEAPLVDRKELQQYETYLETKFEDNIQDYYINPNINLELLYSREVYSKFDDISKFDAYSQNIQKQYYSLLNYPLKNSYYSQMKKNGIDIRFYRNQSNGDINPYINVNQNQGTYVY